MARTARSMGVTFGLPGLSLSRQRWMLRRAGLRGRVPGKRMSVLDLPVGISGDQLARGLQPLKCLGVELGRARGADDRQPGRLVEA